MNFFETDRGGVTLDVQAMVVDHSLFLIIFPLKITRLPPQSSLQTLSSLQRRQEMRFAWFWGLARLPTHSGQLMKACGRLGPNGQIASFSIFDLPHVHRGGLTMRLGEISPLAFGLLFMRF